jgi:lambda repressor-like predicted transcriptional regulator
VLRTPKLTFPRVDPATVAEVANKYKAGARVTDLAAHHGIHRFTVSQILERQGVERRPQGLPAEHLADVIAAYNAGSSLAALAKRMSVARGTIAAELKKAGVPLRPRKGWDNRTR